MEYQAASYDYIIDDIEFFPRESAKQKKRPPRIPKVKYFLFLDKWFLFTHTRSDAYAINTNGPFICSRTEPLLICSCATI